MPKKRRKRGRLTGVKGLKSVTKWATKRTQQAAIATVLNTTSVIESYLMTYLVDVT